MRHGLLALVLLAVACGRDGRPLGPPGGGGTDASAATDGGGRPDRGIDGPFDTGPFPDVPPGLDFGSPFDAGLPDGGAFDGGAFDAGVADAGIFDASRPDFGGRPDIGPPPPTCETGLFDLTVVDSPRPCLPRGGPLPEISFDDSATWDLSFDRQGTYRLTTPNNQNLAGVCNRRAGSFLFILNQRTGGASAIFTILGRFTSPDRFEVDMIVDVVSLQDGSSCSADFEIIGTR